MSYSVLCAAVRGNDVRFARRRKQRNDINELDGYLKQTPYLTLYTVHLHELKKKQIAIILLIQVFYLSVLFNPVELTLVDRKMHKYC